MSKKIHTDCDFNGNQILNARFSLSAPVPGSADAARIMDVENAMQSALAGIDSKVSVRLVAVANVLTSGMMLIDSNNTVAGNRVLLTAQNDPTQNGVYIAAAGAWTRALDADQAGEITSGAFWFVEEGTLYGRTQWRCSNVGVITLGATAIAINQFGASAMYTGGAGLSLTGSDFSVGSGIGIAVSANTVGIDTAVVVRKYLATVGDGVATSIMVAHGLATQDVTTQVRDVTTNSVIDCDIQNVNVNTVQLIFATAPAINAMRVVIHG